MKDRTAVLEWATGFLNAHGYTLIGEPEVVFETPWSDVLRINTSKGRIYIKQTPPLIPLDSHVIQLLSDRFHASVPTVIVVNDDIHAFMMEDAGQPLRQYLQSDPNIDLICETLKDYTSVLRSTEQHLGSFLSMGVPDWRLGKLTDACQQIFKDEIFFKSEGILDEELKTMHELMPTLADLCDALSSYQIPETFVQNDCNTNNMLYDLQTGKVTFVDLGEVVISHPFFPLCNFMFQVGKHHGIEPQSQDYQRILDAYLHVWLPIANKDKLLDAVALAKRLFPIYSVLAGYRLMKSVDLKAFKTYYANRPSGICADFRQYIQECSSI